jgi:hypothetical protein
MTLASRGLPLAGDGHVCHALRVPLAGAEHDSAYATRQFQSLVTA